MVTPLPEERPTDEELVAYLDQELSDEARARIAQRLAQDGELQRRLAFLANGARPFRQAFDALVELAPQARLDAMLSSLSVGGRAAPQPAPAATAGSWWRARLDRRLGLVAACLALFLAGMGSDYALRLWRGSQDVEAEGESKRTWRQEAAEYIALYSVDTLAAIPDTALPGQRELDAIGAKLGMPLSVDEMSLPGLPLKRAQILEYDGKPLAQFAYLDPHSGPIALCIYNEGHGDKPVVGAEQAGLYSINWSVNGRGFMLAGHAGPPELKRLAELLSRRMTL